MSARPPPPPCAAFGSGTPVPPAPLLPLYCNSPPDNAYRRACRPNRQQVVPANFKLQLTAAGPTRELSVQGRKRLVGARPPRCRKTSRIA